MMLTLNDAVTTLWLIKGHWPNFSVLEGNKQALQAGAMLDVLSDLDLAEVRAALARLDVDGRDFPPTPGQIRDSVLSARGVTAPDWDEALREVMQSIHRYGVNRGISLSSDRPSERPKLHPAIEDAVKAMGGWYDVGMAHVTDSWRAQFRDMYKLAAARYDREVKAPPVLAQLAAGLAERLALEPAKEDS